MQFLHHAWITFPLCIHNVSIAVLIVQYRIHMSSGTGKIPNARAGRISMHIDSRSSLHFFKIQTKREMSQ